MLEPVGPEISAPVWTGKELAGLAGDPIGHEAHPLTCSRIDEGQPFGKMVGKPQQIAAPARSPVDRIRLHFKSDLAKDADRAEYSSCHQERERLENVLEAPCPKVSPAAIIYSATVSLPTIDNP